VINIFSLNQEKHTENLYWVNKMIKLKCLNPDCNYVYQVTPAELEDNPQYHDKCLICGSRLKVDNVEEIVKLDIEKRIANYVSQWLKELGGDETLSLIQRHKNQATYRLYIKELRKRGFIIKNEN
jgi:hypothetical protein